MSTSDLNKFPGGTQDKGVNNFEPQIGVEITWHNDTNNVTGGVRRGVGPRYGVAPLGGHNNTEPPTGVSATATNGLQMSETTSGSQGLTHRELIFGVVPITMAPYDGSYPKANQQFYCYLTGLDYGSGTSLDANLGATLTGGVNKQENTFVAGLAQSSYRQESPLVRRHKTELLNLPQTTTPAASDIQDILENISARYWMPYAQISISGKRVPYNWMLGVSSSTGSATGAPDMRDFWGPIGFTGTSGDIYSGMPSEILTNENTDNSRRILQVYALDVSGSPMDISWTVPITQANITPAPAYDVSTEVYHDLTGATKTGAATGYANVFGTLICDPGSFTNSRHEAVLCAGEIPIAVIYQDWLKATKGMMPRWVDLSNPGCIPRPGIGITGNDGLDILPSSVPTAFSTEADTSDDSGILDGSTQYDIGFSYYNKLIDYETNAAYIRTVSTVSGTDHGLVVVGSLDADSDSVWTFMRTFGYQPMPWEFSQTAIISGSPPRMLSLNDYEYRFYFRENGTNEWLPAGSYDASRYWFYGSWHTYNGGVKGPSICTGPVANLPGGQANGFIDYSPLPKQRYIGVTVFQQRAFWWSEKSMHFSLANNIYAYPTRNIVTCPTGKWRGGIVHSQKDLSQQLSRLVVFGDQAYSCWFTGDKTLQSVRVSASTVGQFEIDGSDFRMEYLCDATAFSFRSACVAEGVLYWWGPQGVYQDDGMSMPKKISEVLEPNIWDFVDMGRDTEVHCVYNKRTMEVIWFYPPKVTDANFPTYLLIYNVENGHFYNGKMRCQVDSSQNIKLENDTTPDNVDGERILIHCRASTAGTVQRSFYFDDLVEAGEQGPTRELEVVTISTPSTGTRRFTLASGSVGITAGGIEANDLICVDNAKGYAPGLTNADDMIAKITAVNNGSNYIDILLPDGASWDASASLNAQTAFPIFHKKPTAAGLHGITYNVTTNYWLPEGVSNAWYWLYMYFMFQYTGIPTPTNPFTELPVGAVLDFAYRTLRCNGMVTDTLSLTNNSDGNCQIWHPMRNVARSANGQALKYKISGIHIGNPWTLEYLEAHCKKETGYTLKEFQG